MALNVLNNYAVVAMNNTANAINTAVSGAKEWVKHSDVIWIATGTAYYTTGFAYVQNSLHHPINKTEAAKIVAIACSIYAIFQGMFAEEPTNNKPVDTSLTKLPNRSLIIIMNTAVLALHVANRLKLQLTPIDAVIVTALAYGSVKMVHNASFPVNK